MKKFIIVMVLVTITFLNSCSESNNGSESVRLGFTDKQILVGNISCDFPLVNETSSLSIMTCTHNDIDPSEIFVCKEYETITGVNVDWTVVKKSKVKEAVSTALLNSTNYDLIMHTRINPNILSSFGKSGLIYDLAANDLLPTYAPNCWAYLKSHPDALASVLNPNGTIYSLPQVNSGAELRVSRKILVNKNWLKNINMELPKTTEDFYLMLKAFKEQDANGNGDPNDEIPLCSQDLLSLREVFYGSFGLANRGVHNLNIDYDEQNNKTRLISSSDGYKQWLEYMNRLFTEELLDNYIFNMTMENWRNKAETDKIGVYANTNLATMPADKVDNWIAIEEPLEGPNGDKLFSAIRANFHSAGAAFIPSTCTKPELVLRWLDYFWTDEGTLFYHMGVKDETYTILDDGTYDYCEEIYDEISSGGKTFDDVIATYSLYPGGGNPTVEIAPYFRGGEMAEVPAQAARKLFEYGPEEYWPSFTFTADEAERLSLIEADINKYCDSTCMDYITGSKSFDDWDSYLSQLKRLGSDELLSIYQAAADRYHSLIVTQR